MILWQQTTIGDKHITMSEVNTNKEGDNNKEIEMAMASVCLAWWYRQLESGTVQAKPKKTRGATAKHKGSMCRQLVTYLNDNWGPSSTAKEVAAAINTAAESKKASLASLKKAKGSNTTSLGSKQAAPSGGKGPKKHRLEHMKEQEEEDGMGMTGDDTAGTSDTQSKDMETIQLGDAEQGNADVQEEEEEPHPKDKGKGKARATEGKPKRRCGMFPKTDDMHVSQVPNVKTAEPTKADKLSVMVYKAITEVTLGYALMTVIHNEHGTRKSIASRGLQNKVIWNAMILAVHPGAINKDSLELIWLGTYDNKVTWTSEAGKLEASFMNENHCREVLQPMNIQSTHIQFKRALQEWERSQGLRIGQEWVLVGHFVDREKTDKHPDHSWLMHQLTSNVPVTALADNDNDRLYQVLNILAILNDKEEKARYLDEMQHHEDMMNLLHLQHFWGRSKGPVNAGFTARQLESWVPSIRGVQILLCGYILEVFCFLAAPIDVQLLNSVTKAAEEGVDVAKRCRQVACDMIHDARNASIFAWGIIDEFAEKSLGIWADVTRVSDHDQPWCLWGLKNEASKGPWNKLINKYWHQLLSDSVGLGHEIQLTPNMSADDKVCITLKNKLEWVRMGYLLGHWHPRAFASLLMPKLDLSPVIKEVVSWAEPFAVLAAMQRGVRVWRDHVHPSTNNITKCGSQDGLIPQQASPAAHIDQILGGGTNMSQSLQCQQSASRGPGQEVPG
ncbi:hypothetical protein EDD17DRAFT_1899448 [Pisolithus thermaeus]|nr:hypothetical protein EV401DRAFT_1893704 [Pisolithus croceorrhizus]KAI6158456.1 hypothetical protein EDD17DRAFT_1899448 [Pisolithus thermaeus]